MRVVEGPWQACPCRPWSGARTSCWTAGTATPRSARPASGCAARKLLIPLILHGRSEACGRGLPDGHPAHIQALSWYRGPSSALPSPLVHSSSKGRRLAPFTSTLRMTSELNLAQGFKLVKAAQLAAVALAVVLAWGLAAALGQGVAPLSKVSACILVGERQKTTPCVMWLLNAVTTPTKLDMMMLPQAYCIFWKSSAQKPVQET